MVDRASDKACTYEYIRVCVQVFPIGKQKERMREMQKKGDGRIVPEASVAGSPTRSI